MIETTTLQFNSTSNIHIVNFISYVQAYREHLDHLLEDGYFQQTVEEALLFEVLKTDIEDVVYQITECGREEQLGDQLVYVNIVIRLDGSKNYQVGFANSTGDDAGTICKVEDLATVDEWFDEEWFQVEEFNYEVSHQMVVDGLPGAVQDPRDDPGIYTNESVVTITF